MHNRFEMSMMRELKFFLPLQIHQSPRGKFINQAKYALDIHKKHGMENYDSIGTPMTTKPKLDADLIGIPAKLTKKHLKKVKRIFQYLKNTIHMGLWYLLDFGFELITFSDVDHASSLDTCKSTSGGIHFLGDKLEKVENGIVELYFVGIDYQLANLFTKALLKERFEYLVGRLGMRCLTPAELEALAKETA
ncbi:hypothetical protein Tco_0728288 [Tanacetum coccineum]|uniref:Retrovirus-related Pol polyprotein from transposon TNT 1-94 n=1 Tax=Tanacetum coccineum TaxID=301880 RepID=A0ABQ4YLK2_9ASTR